MNPVHSALLTAKRRRYEDGGAPEAKAPAPAPAVEVARAATSAAADKAPAISEADIQNLYKTTKGIEREADAAGLEYWKEKAANGMTLDQMQDAFNKAAQDPLEAAKSDTMKSTGAVASFGNNPPVPPTKPLYLQNFDYSQYDNPFDARYAYLSKTFNPTIAAAMMGNYTVESFNNPNQFQTNTGAANGTPIFDKNNMPTGYGAAMWGGTRLTNPNAGQNKMGLFDFADKFGFDPNSTEGQDRFSVYELTQNPEYAGAYKDLLSAGTNINKATQIFGDQYESPKNLNASLADRQAKAGLYQNYYSNPSSLSAADQAAIAKTKTGMFDPAFQKYAADKAAAEKATQLAKTQTQTVTDPMVDTTGFNTGVDTSVNDRIMQQSNDYINQSLQNNLNNNFVDANNLNTGMGTYNTGMSFSSDNSGRGMGTGSGNETGVSIMNGMPDWYIPNARGGAVGHALRLAHHYATGGHTPAQPDYEREIDRINRMLAEKAEVNPATQDWSARRNEYLQGRPGPQIRDRSFARGGYAEGGGAESVLMQDKLNAPNQWLQFGGQDMDRAPAGLPIGQAVGTSMGYHGVEGLQDATKLANQVIAGKVDPTSDEGIQRALNAAMVAQTGGIGGAPKGSVLGSGPIRAYHGSPHDFERFDLSKIGTGEGAQAYGHGLYFAENEPVAKGYRDKLTEGTYKTNTGEIFDPFKNIEQMNVKVASYKGIDNAIERAKGLLADDPNNQMIIRDLEKLNNLKGQNAVPNTGHMYDVQINADPEHLMDWDKPLNAQSKYVQDAVKDVANKVDIDPFEHLGLAAVRKEHPRSQTYSPTGNDIHTDLEEILGGKEAATNALLSSGIKGIRYLDAGSRGNGGYSIQLTHNGKPYADPIPMQTFQQAKNHAQEYEKKGYGTEIKEHGTRNYVVFDDNLVNINKKYEKGGTIPFGPEAAQRAVQIAKQQAGRR